MVKAMIAAPSARIGPVEAREMAADALRIFGGGAPVAGRLPAYA